MSDAAPERLNAALSDRYTVERKLGEGGMATVYLARDLKHNRNVALKVLKPELAAVVGAERFLAEIETTANLQHPHILPLFDSGEADGFLFYVMPYIDGETLRERIEREHQLPVDEAVRIAVGMGNALAHAHDKGVIHRDIKPANILMQDGEPLIADFGIALAVGAAGGSRLTETGLSVGTPFYMSPEQATGDQSIGPSSDQYALAAVLYEMLTGEPPYTGTTAQAVLGRILQGAPVSATQMRQSVPANVDAAIRKALEKLPADRFTGVQAFTKALGDPGFRYGGEAEAAAAAAGAGSWKRNAMAGWAVAAGAIAGLAWATLRPEPAPVPEWYESPFAFGQEPSRSTNADYALSPDGSFLVYAGQDRSPDAMNLGTAGLALWLRRWSDPDARPIAGTSDGQFPRISPDGRQLAFEQYQSIKVLSLDGGPAVTLGVGFGYPVWGPDGFVYFSNGNVLRAPSTGGAVDTLARVGAATNALVPSQILPGGKHALVTQIGFAGSNSVHVLDLETREMSLLTEAGFEARYAESGHLLMVNSDGELLAARYDPKKPTELGPIVALMDGVYSFALSEDGRLVFSTSGLGTRIELVWVTREGVVTPVEEGWAFDPGGIPNAGWSLSPDVNRIAFKQVTDAGPDVWIKDLRRGTTTRLTFTETNEYMPRWSPDGSQITFIADADEDQLLGMDVWTTASDGTGEPTLLLEYEAGFAGGFWAPGGEWLVLRRVGSTETGLGARDILGYRPGTDSEPVPLVATPEYAEQGPAVSSDGRWLAYTSDETGRPEVFVRPFPNTNDGKYPISTDGGIRPLWANNGRELFYVNADGDLMIVEFDATDGFDVTDQRVLFRMPDGTVAVINTDFLHITPDDQRFLMARGYREATDRFAGLTMVTNFHEILKQRVRD